MKYSFCILILLMGSLYGGPVVQLGGFSACQGKSQHIDIEGLIGDDFNLKKETGQNILVGVGYYEEWNKNVLWGVNAFYFAPTEVKGNVKQEDLFTNLSYRYSLTYYPIYLGLKALFCGFTMDIGIGPTLMSTGNFKEHSLDGGITIPDTIFSGKSVVSFSATAGLGWRINPSLEINYRFFYLGQGKFRKLNNQVRDTLHTGHNYANALFLSIFI